MSDIENDEMSQEEAKQYENITDESSLAEQEVEEEPVFELKEKPKKGRAPMSEERKEKLREQLKNAREKKKALKAEGKEVAKAPKVVKVLEATESEPAVYVKNVKKIVNTEETNSLKKELAEMKHAKAEEARIKLEKKEATAAKRKATKDKKELEKKLAKNVVATPAPALVKEVSFAPPVAEETTKPIYSTYKTSIWSKLM